MTNDNHLFLVTCYNVTIINTNDIYFVIKSAETEKRYNVQVAVGYYFIVHTYVSNDRTDYDTLIPVIEKHKKAFDIYPK